MPLTICNLTCKVANKCLDVPSPAVLWVVSVRERKPWLNGAWTSVSLLDYYFRLVYQNNLSFSERLDLDKSVTAHHKNLQVFVTEIFTVKNRVASAIMNEIFEQQNTSFSFKSSSNQLRRENIKTAQSHNDLQSVRYLGQKIWELLPSNIKCSNSASKFK